MKRTQALIDMIVFPGGYTKAFTMSYDDGTVHDRRFVELLNRYRIKGTFNLNSGIFGLQRKGVGPNTDLDISVIQEEEVRTLYEGHEIAGHGSVHASPTDVGTPAFMFETIEDKEKLEEVTGKMVRGYAYPFGAFNEDVKKILKLAGYHYARVVDTTGKFDIPQDFLEWRGTAHHNDPKLMELAEEFCRNDFFGFRKKLFYVWGHSYEFEGDGTWDKIEAFLKFMDEHREGIWFASNIEIVDYVNAYRSLEYSADGNMIYNPTAIPVTFARYRKNYTVQPGETLYL
ncbi:MAG: polysaccharide deacetylase family protein [Lachnospiraceae bacterium]|nr:polysaccharide deacetylase family protein [Lachnospiraceae bacterium]